MHTKDEIMKPTDKSATSQFKRLVDFNLRAVKSLLNRIILLTDGELFCALFNFKSMVLGRDVRFTYDRSAKKYRATSSKYELWFYHKTQANLSYAHGVSERAYDLMRAYMLDRVSFGDGDVIVDCGANYGDLKLYFSEIGVNVEYIGFEPSPLEFECLSHNVTPSVVNNMGLWNSEGELKFFVSSQGADSSFIEPASFDQVKKIRTARLDTLLDKPIKLLKLEAEGAEPEVLEGAQKLLPKVEWISADLGYERGVTQESTLVPVVNFLLNNEFELVDMSHDRIVALFRNKNIGPLSVTA